MPSEFYNEEDAEAILREASRRMPAGGAMSRERLFATAAELGISPDVVLAAEQSHIQKSVEAELAQEFKLFQRGRFWERGSRNAVIGSIILGFYLLGSHHSTWILIVAGIFFIRLALLVPGHFVTTSERYKLAFIKWKRKRGSSGT